MKKIIYPLPLFLSIAIFSQVGVNTNTPKATLDIEAATNPTTADGILIPRVSKLRAKNMISPEISTLIYINNISDDNSTTGTVGKINAIGFYYFNGSQWIKIVSENNDTNIYNTDGSLNGDREVNQSSYKLAFTSTATYGNNHFSVNNSTLSVNTATNRVGIGTTNPQSKLHIEGDLLLNGPLKVGPTGTPGNANQVLVSNGIASPPEWADLASDGNNVLTFNNGLQENATTPNLIQLGGPLITDTEINAQSNKLKFTSDNTTNNSAFTIEKTGEANPILYGNFFNNRLGIGTNTPLQKLHVNGNMHLAKALYVGSGAGLAGTPGQILRSNGGNTAPEWVDFTNDGTNTYTFNNGLQEDPNLANNIELGGPLVQNTEINTKGFNFSINGSTQNAFSLKTNQADSSANPDQNIVLSADLQNRKVGIGTKSPTQTLDINGDLRIRDVRASTTSNNQVLTINSNGVVQKMNPHGSSYFVGGSVYTKYLSNQSYSGFDTSRVASSVTIDGVNFQSSAGGMVYLKGNGYKISNSSNGIFVIKFDTPFEEIYGVSLNVIDAYTSSAVGDLPNYNFAGSNLNLGYNAQVSYVANDLIIVKTGQGNSRENISFSFLITGK